MNPIHFTAKLGWPQQLRRTSENAATYASPLTRYDVTRAGHRFVAALSLIGLCVVVGLLFLGAL